MQSETAPLPTLAWPPLALDPAAPHLPGALAPGEGEVVLVAAALDWPERPRAALWALLDPWERERAGAFYTQRLRDRQAAGRGLLRLLLGAALGRDPASLRFHTGEHGKPALAAGGPALAFNVSHSQGLALYGFAREGALGVDVEAILPRHTDEVADRFFAPGEAAALRRLPEEARRDAFFGIWCCKEAFIKATGKGLAEGLSTFEFALGERGPVRLAWRQGEPDAPARWSVHLLDPAPGFRAALVSDARPARLRTFSLAPPDGLA